MRKKILIITTGGTIEMKKARGGVVPDVNDKVLTKSFEYLDEFVNYDHMEICNLPSPHIDMKIWDKLHKAITKNIPKYDGIVITHGTDILEDTAYFLNITINTNKPIVLTAAMRSMDEVGSDGPRNLISACRVASSNEAIGKGVLVVTNDEIHYGEDVNKTYTSNVATFDSPGFGPLGLVDDGAVIFYRDPVEKESYNYEGFEEKISIIKSRIGDDGLLAKHALEEYKGIVVEGFGRGNIPPKLARIIKSYANKKPIVLTTRCFKGRVLDVYGYEGGGKDLKESGVILAHHLSTQKAAIKLMILLKSYTLEEIRGMF